MSLVRNRRFQVAGRSGWLLPVCGIAASLAPIAASAQDKSGSVATLQEVIVTAQRRQQNIQDVPISVSALSGKQLENEGVASTSDLGYKVPGVNIFQFGQNATTTVTVRGVSQNDFTDHNEAPIAVYEDGAYNSFIGGAGFNLFDVERVEALRGPQGTLFGRNATGGVIQIIDKKPTDTFEGYATLNVGDYGLERLDGALSGPISKTLSSRLSISATHETGYVKNTIGPADEGSRNLSTRLQFDFHPNSDVDYLLNVHTVRDDVTGTVAYKTTRSVFFSGVDNGLVNYPASFAEYQAFCQGFFFSTPPPGASNCFGYYDPNPANPWVVSHNTPGVMDRTEYGATGTLTWRLNPSVEFVNITDYRFLRRNYLEDTDGTPANLFNYYANMDSWQASDEARLAGKSGSVNWQAGVYYLHIQHHIWVGIDANTGFAPAFDFITANNVHQTTNSYSAYGQADWKFAPRWTLTLGARYTDDLKYININSYCSLGGCVSFGVGSPDFVQGTGFNDANAPGLTHKQNGMVSAKAELGWRPVQGLLVYGMVNRGTKGGGFNASAIEDIPIVRVPYDPEVLTDYEIGVKDTFWQHRAQLDADVFYYHYQNYQAYSLIGLSPVVFNAQALNRGGELTFHVLPTSGLDISLGVAYENPIVKNVPLQFGVGPYVDQHPPQSPKLTEDLDISQTWLLPNEGTITLQGVVNHVGQRWFNTINDPVLQDGAYTTENARLTYGSPSSDWEFGVWVNNLSNTQYVLTAFDMSTTEGTVNRVYAPPRQFGATITYKFR